MDEDRISALCDEIIHSILSFLPTDSAIRTGTLSKRWVNLWKYVNIIHFPSLPESETEMDYGYVDRCLDVHKAQNITKFIVMAHFGPLSNPNIGNWINFAVTRHVKCLEIYMEVDIKDEYFRMGDDIRDDYFKLPDSFYLGDDTEFVEHIALSCVEFSPPPRTLGFLGYASLKRLFLYDSCVWDEGLDVILATCKVLESLSLIRCSGIRNVKVSSLVLKEFEFMRYECDAHITFEIDAPNLVTLKGHEFVRWITRFNISCHLREVKFCDFFWEGKGVLYHEHLRCLMAQISHVEIFGINGCLLEHVCKALHGGPSISFNNLKEFYLSGEWRMEDDAVDILGLLGDFPSLNKLQIEFKDACALWWGMLKMVPSRDVARPCNHWKDTKLTGEQEELLSKIRPFHHLKTIELFYYSGIGDEVELLERILQKAVNLERVVLFFEGPKHHVLKYKDFLDTPVHIKRRLVEEASLLPKASPHAQVFLG